MSNLNIAPIKRSKEAARHYYNLLSPAYDLLTNFAEGHLLRQGLQLLDLKTGEIVCDMGCGTGNALPLMAHAVGETGKVIGVDISEMMLGQAAQKMARAGYHRGFQLIRSDAAALPAEMPSCDAILMSFALEAMDTPDIPCVLNQCRAHLSMKGRMCVIALSKSSGSRAAKFYDWLHRRAPFLMDCRPILLHQILVTAGWSIVKTIERQGVIPVEIILAKPQ